MADKNYEHLQNVPSATWDIQHNLNKFPEVVIIDSAGDEVEGALQYVSANRVIASFAGAFSGRAILN